MFHLNLLKFFRLKLRHMDQKGVSLLGDGTLHALRGDSLWFRNLYLQILDGMLGIFIQCRRFALEEKVSETERGVPVMIRRWFANKLEVGPVSEVRVFSSVLTGRIPEHIRKRCVVPCRTAFAVRTVSKTVRMSQHGMPSAVSRVLPGENRTEASCGTAVGTM